MDFGKLRSALAGETCVKYAFERIEDPRVHEYLMTSRVLLSYEFWDNQLEDRLGVLRLGGRLVDGKRTGGVLLSPEATSPFREYHTPMTYRAAVCWGFSAGVGRTCSAYDTTSGMRRPYVMLGSRRSLPSSPATSSEFVVRTTRPERLTPQVQTDERFLEIDFMEGSLRRLAAFLITGNEQHKNMQEAIMQNPVEWRKTCG